MTAAPYRPCVIIPSYNHSRVVGDIVATLVARGLPVFLIDDGSDASTQQVLAALHDPALGVHLHRLASNQGKGKAVIQGFHLARDAGYTHAIQIDADGQHDLGALTALIDASRKQPHVLVSGLPQYDDSIPRSRAIGRWITHLWVWVETLSLHIRDTMCGFRVYPLAAVFDLLATGDRIGDRMDFDIEIMVRMFWRGTPVAHTPVRVVYPKDNTSNFDVWRDNMRISAMHTRLVFWMLAHLPTVLNNRARPAGRHWAALGERGLYWGLRLCALTYRVFGRRVCRALVGGVTLYFYLTDRTRRRASRAFLARAYARLERRPPTALDSLRHFQAFGARCVDTFAAWAGLTGRDAFRIVEGQALEQAMASPRGGVFIVAHLGNPDMLRALADKAVSDRFVVLVHTRHAANFSRVLKEFGGDATLNTLQVTEIGPEVAIQLKERVEAGAWIIIAGDRTPVASTGRVSRVPFLGRSAAFSQGPYLLAFLLECPVYLLFCRRVGAAHHVFSELFTDRVNLPRATRQLALRDYAARYAERLEQQALADPYQWYNFFDFWAGDEQNTP